MHALVFPLGPDWYAFEMRSVREVVPHPIVTAVPSVPANLLGLFNLRGEIVPLFDTAPLLGLGETGPGAFCVVVLTAAGPAALTTSGMPESAELGDPVSGTGNRVGISCHAVGTRLVTLLDVDGLLTVRHVALDSL